MQLVQTDPENVLIVDDEEPIRRTFREWLQNADLGCRVLTARDAEEALLQANQSRIDLAILDWNLGSGNHGLQLLEDLRLFNAEIVAIMITGYAHQATPLDAMRMGVRDYLDKNQDLDRPTFVRVVRVQLERIRRSRAAARLHQGLVVFRSAVEKALPLVQTAAALHDPVPLPVAISQLFRFLIRTTGAREGVLQVRSFDDNRDPPELARVHDSDGQVLAGPTVPFARSLAGSVASHQQPCQMLNLDQAARGGSFELEPFERGRRSVLAAPLNVGPGTLVVLELFDKTSRSGEIDSAGFTDADRQLLSAAADFGAEMLRQALAERQTKAVLFNALEAALSTSHSVSASLGPQAPDRPEDPPAESILQGLRAGLGNTPAVGLNAEETVELAEAARALAVRHGSGAVRHCIEMIQSLHRLLDEATGAGEMAP